nr:protein SMG7-like isoform X1 [Ipomoea batatas]
MTIPMDNSVDHSSRERVQRLFNKNVELENKRRKAAQARIPSDPNSWQQMRENYEAIILENHAFSEQHEIEYALWQLHYRRIEELRAYLNAALSASGSTTSQNGKGPSRGGPDRITKIRTQFKTFLSEATGFYHDLMLKIRAKYGLPLGYFSDDPENQIPSSKDGSKSADMKKGLISCHRCLIYLGDLARYKGLYGEGDSKARDFSAASSYYMQASSLWPASGNPHHQLAILASYSGDELVAIYRYFRSLAVENPFTTARDNLIIAFEKNRQNYSQLLGDAKSSVKVAPARVSGKGRGKGDARFPQKEERVEANPVKERASSISDIFKIFSTRFVRLNGVLFTRTSLETFGEVLSVVKNDLLELLSSGPDEKYSFGSDAADCRLAVVRLVAILIFTVYNVNREAENQSYAEILQRSVLLQNAYTAVFEFMGHVVERCGQLNDPSASFLLPGVMIFVEWLACHEDIAVGNEPEETQANARSFFWNNCITFLNKLLSSGSKFVDEDEDETCFFNMSKYDEAETANRLALPEDFELRGFLPLVPAQLILDFSRKHSLGGDVGSKERKARIQRLVGAGKALASVVRVGGDGVYFDTKAKKFVIGTKPQISDDYWLSSTLEDPTLSGVEQENPVGGQMVLGALSPKPQLFIEGEEEDEVIVFKPSMSEKHMDGFSSNMITSHVPVSSVTTVNAPLPAVNVSGVDLGIDMGVFSSGLDGLLMQNGFNPSLRLPTSVVNNNAHYVSSIQPSSSIWSSEQSSVTNGLAHLNLMENGSAKSEMQDHSGLMQTAAYSVPFPQSLNFTTADNIPIQFSEVCVPSKLNSISVAGLDCMAVKSSSIISTGSKKNPVSRPIRHRGPPPGFGSVPPKVMDDSSSAMALKNENTHALPMDDYSWLDGYQLPSTNQSSGYSTINQSVQASQPPNSSNSMGMASFPFPGKQVSPLYVQADNQKGWPDFQMSEQMKLYQEQQQQQLQRGNQQTVALPQQYQGQSLWEGRFFV